MTKKLNVLCLLSIVLLCGILGGCKESKEDVNNLEINYFYIIGAAYQGGSLPSGDASLITNLKVNNSAINGGSTIVEFTSNELLGIANISVEGEEGYYICPLAAQSGSGPYTYMIVLNLSQNLSANFVITVSVQSSTGSISRIVNSNDINVIEVGTGKLQVSLSWDVNDDLDLYLMEPGEENIIYFGSPFAVEGKISDSDWNKFLDGYDGESNFRVALSNFLKTKNYVITGELDLDSNAACYIDGVRNENITYKSNVKNGTYDVFVNLWEKCQASTVGATYSVTANYNGVPVELTKNNATAKLIGKYKNTDKGNQGELLNSDQTVSDQFVYIGSFTIGNTKNTISTDDKTSVIKNLPVREKYK